MCPKQALHILPVLVLLWAASGAAFPQPQSSDPTQKTSRIKGGDPPALQLQNPRYRICLGDVLDAVFRLTPEFNQTVTVQPDGFISLREVPDLHVVGKTIPELSQLLEEQYSRILHDPVITVVVTEFEKPYFIAQGEVGKPGKYELRGDTTVLEAIGIAGGFNEKAKHSQVLLIRRISDEWRSVKVVDVKEMLATADLSEDLHLRPGDMLYVPKNVMSKIRSFIPSASVGIYGPGR